MSEHRNLYMAGFIWYALWSIIAGVSVYDSTILFIVSRAFPGIRCALLVPNALALVGRTLERWCDGEWKRSAGAVALAAALIWAKPRT